MNNFLMHADNLNAQLRRILKYGQPPKTTPFSELPKGKGSCIMEEEVADLIDT